MPEIPFRQTPPDYRTIVDGIWSDLLDKWLATFEVSESSTAKVQQRVTLVDEGGATINTQESSEENYYLMIDILHELRLLNERFEHAFETSIEHRSMNNVHLRR